MQMCRLLSFVWAADEKQTCASDWHARFPGGGGGGGGGRSSMLRGWEMSVF